MALGGRYLMMTHNNQPKVSIRGTGDVRDEAHRGQSMWGTSFHCLGRKIEQQKIMKILRLWRPPFNVHMQQPTKNMQAWWGGRGKGEEIRPWDGVQGVLLHCFDGERGGWENKSDVNRNYFFSWPVSWNKKNAHCPWPTPSAKGSRGWGGWFAIAMPLNQVVWVMVDCSCQQSTRTISTLRNPRQSWKQVFVSDLHNYSK